jgi:Acetyltransferase (GNAT) domain
MASVFRPSTPEDEPRIIEFLTRVFSLSRDEPFVNPALLRWKYWAPRTDCPDPRSLVIERDGRIVAHAGLWPVTVKTGAARERGVEMIDWASDPQAPGSGVSLLQRFTKSYDFVFSVGGTEGTQTVLPKFGFQVVGDALTWARPLRPFRQILQHQHKDLRLPMRLARNLWWSKTPSRMVEQGWTAVDAGAQASTKEFISVARERDEGFFEYLQQCPAARFLNFYIERSGRREGFFALSIVGEQTRLAGLWLENPSPENWRAAFQLVQSAAWKSGTSELVARCLDEARSTGAQQAGLRLRGQTPVFLFRKSTGPLPIQFQLCDDDACFLSGRRTEFLT